MKILQSGVASILQSKLRRFGWSLRKELWGSNSVAHVTLISNEEFARVDQGEITWARIRRYNYVVVLVKLCGIVAFKSGPSQIAAIKVEVLGGNEIRRDLGLEEQDTPHISCCYKYIGGGY